MKSKLYPIFVHEELKRLIAQFKALNKGISSEENALIELLKDSSKWEEFKEKLEKFKDEK